MSTHAEALSPASGHATHDDHDPAATAAFGFWIYILTDCVLFASIFATFAVLGHNYAGGPNGREIFDLPYVFVETMCLLVSSATYGLAVLSMNRNARSQVLVWLFLTFLLGLGFVGMEINEFTHMILAGNGPNRSGFLSGFFTLVGTHGIHVTSGLVWIAVMWFQVMSKGLTDRVRSRLVRLSMFWHFLDIVWIGVFSVVYLNGVL